MFWMVWLKTDSIKLIDPVLFTFANEASTGQCLSLVYGGAPSLQEMRAQVSAGGERGVGGRTRDSPRLHRREENWEPGGMCLSMRPTVSKSCATMETM